MSVKVPEKLVLKLFGKDMNQDYSSIYCVY